MNLKKFTDFMGKNSHALFAYIIAIILLTSIFLKIVRWADYLEAIQNTYFYILLGRPNLVYTSVALIVIECITAVLLLIKKQRQKGAFISFMLFNLFLISISLDSKFALNNEHCSCFGAIHIKSVFHVIIIILVSCASMWIYANSSSKITETKNLIINFIVYIFMAILIAYPILSNRNKKFSIQKKADILSWIRENNLLEPSDFSFDILAYINLGELNCGFCKRNIDQFIKIISKDTLIRNRTLILTSHPNKINGITRAKGWRLSLGNHLKFGYLPFEKINNLGISSSIVIIFKPNGKLQEIIELSNPQEELIKKMDQLRNELINGGLNKRRNR